MAVPLRGPVGISSVQWLDQSFDVNSPSLLVRRDLLLQGRDLRQGGLYPCL